MDTHLHSAPPHLDERSLLLALDEIVRGAAEGDTPLRTLTNIACLIGNRFGSDVCSIYLLEADELHLVLSATVGLKREAVGKVRMRLDEGLTGLVAQQMQPVLVDEATRHPRFRYFPEAGEDPYHSFLGAPIIDRGLLQGVLVVQTTEPRFFSPDETQALVNAGRQLGPQASRFRSA